MEVEITRKYKDFSVSKPFFIHLYWLNLQLFYLYFFIDSRV